MVTSCYSVKLSRILPGQPQRRCLVLAIFMILTIHSQSAQPPISTIASSYAISSSKLTGNATGVACAIASDGFRSVQCWGQESSLITVPAVHYGHFFGLVAGASFFCGLWSKSSEATPSLTRAACWSAVNLSVELPLPTEYRNVAFSTLAAGASHVCGIVSNSSEPWHIGDVLCWIPELNGTKPAQPAPIYPLGSYATIAAGHNFTCGIPALNQTTLVCWGNIPPGVSRSAGFESVTVDSAEGGTILTSNFRDTLHDYTFSAISAGESHVCVLLAYSYQAGDSGKPTSQPMCWGSVTTGQSPLPNPPDAGFSLIVSGTDFSCGIRYNDSRLQCWSDREDQGPGFQFPIPPAHEIRAASAGDTFVCVLADTVGDNSLLRAYCLGEGAPNCRICGSDSHLQKYNDMSQKSGDDASPVPASGREPQSRGPTALYCLLGITLVVALLQLIYILSRQEFKGHKRIPAFRSVQHFHEQEHLKVTEFTYKQLEMATEGFSDKNLVGKGSYGHVFKGTVHCPVTRLVAVKRLEHKPASSLHNRFVDFDSELKLLARLHHPNLVNLVGFCHERGPEANFRVSPHGIRCAIKYAIHSYKYAQHQHHATALSGSEASLEKQEQGIIHDRRLLVFNYMENGTLYDHLHGKGDTLESSTVQHLSQLVSAWAVRLRVAAQAAKGLEYLHCMVPPVIHRDVKSSNILLDKEWNAKLSDFGISRLGPQGQQTHVFTDPKGTPGYWDPEYFRTYHLSLKSDVYGFGVVLLELLTGQKAIDRQQHPDGDANLVSRCRSLIQDGQISAILDPRIVEGDRRQTESICKLGNIAEICVRESQKERPTMRQVASWMEQLVQSLSGLRHSLDFDIESETFDNPLVSNLSCGMGKSQSVVFRDAAAMKHIPGNVLLKSRRNPSEDTIPEVPEELLTTSSQDDSGGETVESQRLDHAAAPATCNAPSICNLRVLGETMESQRLEHAAAPATCNAPDICNLRVPSPPAPTLSDKAASPEPSPKAANVSSPESAVSLPSRSPPVPDAPKTVSHSGPLIGAATKSKALPRPPRPPHSGPLTALRPTLTMTRQSFPAVDAPAKIIYSGFNPTNS